MVFKRYIDESRDVNWGTNGEGLSIDQIRLGAELRMAKSLELIAKNKQHLEWQVKHYKDLYERAKSRYELEKRRSAAYKGQITKIRNKQTEDYG